MEPTDPERNLRRWQARRLGEFDRQVQEFRRFYDSRTPEQRARFREWLSAAAGLNSLSLLIGCGSDQRSALGVAVGVLHCETDPAGGVAYSGAAMVSPAAILRALDLWDRGEDFVPSSEAEVA